MSKKFKNQPCVYCGSYPDDSNNMTADHVFAKKWFSNIDERNNLPKVPACRKCNNEKSKLENYCLTIFPFGGRQENSLKILEEDGAKRLNRNKKLKKSLEEGYQFYWAVENGIYSQHIAIPFVQEEGEQLFIFIVKGLVYFHWNVLLNPVCFIDVCFPTKLGDNILDSFFKRKMTNHLKIDLGMLSYEGIQDNVNNNVSVWKFKVAGGLVFTNRNTPAQMSDKIFVLTGSKESKLNERASRIGKLLSNLAVVQCPGH
ncbi:MAG: HNH endonuclease [Candidatus Wallbacteria bacterium]|nr:HNH endonuclease [Candidatus Wallbacteria bacterium]